MFEGDLSLGFLDRRPLFSGHVLLVLKQHIETLPGLPPELIPSLFTNPQFLSKAVPLAAEAKGSFVAMISQATEYDRTSASDDESSDRLGRGRDR